MSKEWWQLRQLATGLIESYRVSIRRACSVVKLHYSNWHYKPHRREDRPLRQRIKEIAAARVRYGMWRIYVLLRREGYKDNHKRVHRIYKEEGLNLRSKRPRRNKASAHRMERPDINSLNQCWSMDFVTDNLFNGQRFRCLTIVDNFSRYCHAIWVGRSIKGTEVVEVLESLMGGGQLENFSNLQWPTFAGVDISSSLKSSSSALFISVKSSMILNSCLSSCFLKSDAEPISTGRTYETKYHSYLISTTHYLFYFRYFIH